MRITKFLSAILVAVVIYACSNSEDNSIVGFWKSNNNKDSYLNVVNRGDGYSVVIYESSQFNGELEKNEVPADFKDNALSLITPWGVVPALYKQSEGTLILNGNKKFTKISKDKALSEIEAIMVRQKSEKELCMALQKEVDEKKLVITDNDEWDKYVDGLQARIPKGCIIIGDEKGY